MHGLFVLVVVVMWYCIVTVVTILIGFRVVFLENEKNTNFARHYGKSYFCTKQFFVLVKMIYRNHVCLLCCPIWIEEWILYRRHVCYQDGKVGIYLC